MDGGIVSGIIVVSISLYDEICKNIETRYVHMGYDTSQKTIEICILGISWDECLSPLVTSRSADDHPYSWI